MDLSIPLFTLPLILEKKTKQLKNGVNKEEAVTQDSIQKINRFIDDPTTSEFARTVLSKALNRELSQSLNDIIKVKRLLEEVFNVEFVIDYKKI